jgi:hypothetical protein
VTRKAVLWCPGTSSAALQLHAFADVKSKAKSRDISAEIANFYLNRLSLGSFLLLTMLKLLCLNSSRKFVHDCKSLSFTSPLLLKSTLLPLMLP